MHDDRPHRGESRVTAALRLAKEKPHKPGFNRKGILAQPMKCAHALGCDNDDVPPMPAPGGGSDFEE